MKIISNQQASERQVDYVRGLQRQLHLPNHMLDAHCVSRFDCPFAELSRTQVSALIDELKDWADIPADLQRAFGQRDLPGLDAS